MAATAQATRPAGDAPLSPVGVLAALASAALFALFFQQIGAVRDGAPLLFGWEWAPSLGVRFSFMLDGLSLVFALLITGIGALVLLYSSSYLARNPQFPRFVLFLFAFELSMLGLVLSDNLITLFVFWELTTVTSYLLIGFSHTEKKARRNALQALLLTGMGGLALLAGFILLGFAAGTFELSEILTQGDAILNHALYLPILILVLIGAFTKSAQFPLHFWLPNAMAAPTPVSAYLHSATMVKAGVYLLARLHPTLAGSEFWLWTLTVFGAVTAVWASLLAVRQTDLKQALAYTTLMALGILVMFLGGSSEVAITAAATFLIVHSLYKASLFLVVGILDYRTKTRDVYQLSGLARAMPITAAAAAVSAFSMAGFPPFLGFIGKELKYKGALAVASEPMFVAAAALLANALMVAVAAMIAFGPFFSRRHVAGPGPDPFAAVREAPWPMWIGPAILATLGALFGIAPDLIASSLVEPAVAAIRAEPGAYELKLWHGINLPLALSIATFALGLALFWKREALRRALIWLEARIVNLDLAWDGFMAGVASVSAWQTGILQSGVLRRYMFTIFATLLVAIGGALWAKGFFSGALAPGIPETPDALLKHWAIVALVLAGTLTTVVAGSRIVAIAGLGVVGIGVALIFIVYGAPDVAITQLLVETLVIVLVAVAMLRLPLLEPEGGVAKRPVDALLAVGVGGVTTVVLYLATLGPIDRRLTDYFETASWPEAFGRNIVNVILVDFRALDTFGEIAVVVIAALGAFALLRGARGDDDAETSTAAGAQPTASPSDSPAPQETAR